MPRRYADQDQGDDVEDDDGDGDGDEPREDEGPDPSDLGDDADDDGVETVPCPHCRRPIYEEAPQCPYCGEHVSAGLAHQRKPLWILLTIVVLVALMVLLLIKS